MYQVMALFNAVDNISGVMQTIGGNAETLSGRLARIGEEMQSTGARLTAGLTTPILGLAGAVAKFSADYESYMTVARTMTGSNAEQFDLYKEKVLELTRVLPQNANTLAQALYFIASAGYRGQEAIDILTVSGKAAANSLSSIETVAHSVVGALRAYNLSSSEAVAITDMLSMGVIEGTAEFESFAASIGRVLPIASAAGVGFNEVMASLATMTRVGLTAEEATFALRQALMNLFAPTKEATDTLADLGLSADEVRASIREKGLLATLAMLMEVTGGNVTTLDRLFGNVRSLVGVMATAGVQAEDYRVILDKVNASLGTTDEAFAVTAQTARVQLGLLANMVYEVALNIGDIMLPKLKEWVGGLRSFGETLRTVNPDTLELGLKLALLAAAVGPVLIVLGSLVTVLGALLTPMGALLAALAALGAAFIADFGGIRTTLEPLLGWLGQAFVDLAADLRTNSPAEIITEWVPRIIPMLRTLVDFLVTHIGAATPQIAAGLEEWAAAFTAWAGPLATVVSQQLSSLGADILAWVSRTAGELAVALGQWAANWIDYLVPRSGDFVAAAAGFLAEVLAWIAARTADIAQALVKWGQEWAEFLAPYAPVLLEEAQGLLAELVGWIGRKASEIASALQDWAQEWVEFLQPGIAAIPGHVADFVARLVQAIGAGVSRIASALQDWAQQWLDFLQPVIPEIPGRLSAFVSQLVAAVVGAVPKVADALAEWAAPFVEWIAPQIPALLKALGTFLYNILMFIADAVPKVVAALFKLGTAFVEWLLPRVPDILRALVTFLAQLAAGIVAGVVVIAAAAAKLAAGFFKAIPEADKFLGAVWDLLEAVASWVLTDGVGTVTAALEPFVEAFLSWAKTAAEKVAEKCDVIATNIETWVTDKVEALQTKAQEIGAAILAGIGEGIDNMVEWLKEKLDWIISLLPEWAKRILGITSPSRVFIEIGQDIMIGLAEGIDQKKLDVLEAITGAIDNILRNVASIVETLSQRLPTPQTTISDILTRAFGVTQETAAFMSQPGVQDMIDWFSANFQEPLEKWSAALQPLESLLSTIGNILQAAGERAATVRLDVEAAFRRVDEIMVAVANLLWPVREKLLSNIALFTQNIVPLLEDWNDALEPLNTLLSTATGLLETASTKAASVKLDVETAFRRVDEIMVAVANLLWPVREKLVNNIALFAQNIVPLLEGWNAALEPLNTLLSTAAGLLETAAQPVADVELAVDLFFNNLAVIMQQVYDYITWADSEGLFSAFIASFAALGDLLVDWNAALGPLADLLSTGSGILETTATPVADVQLAVDLFFNNLAVIMQQVYDYIVWADGEGLFSAFIASFATLSELLTDWNTALGPLADLLSTGSGLLQTTATPVADVQMAVDLFFNNLAVIMQQVYDYIVWADSEGLFSAFIASFATLSGVLAAFNTAIAPLSELLSTGSGILHTAAVPVADVQMAVGLFFNNLALIMQQVYDYILWADSEGLFSAFIASFATISGVLTAFNTAIAPLSDLLSTGSGILETTAAPVLEIQMAVEAFFTNLLQIMREAYAYVTQANEDAVLSNFVASFGTLSDLLTRWATALEPLDTLLSTASGILETTATPVAEVKMKVDALLSSLLQIMLDVDAWIADHAEARGFVDRFNRDVTPVLVAWNGALVPLAEILTTGAGILETLSGELADVRGKVGTFLGALFAVTQEVDTWMTNNIALLNGLIVAFRDTFNPVLTEWKNAIGPLDSLVVEAKGLYDDLNTDMGDVADRVSSFLDEVYGMISGVSTWFAAHPNLAAEIVAMVTTIKPYISGLNTALKLLRESFANTNSYLDNLIADAQLAKLKSADFLEALIWDEPSTLSFGGGISAAIDAANSALEAALGRLTGTALAAIGAATSSLSDAMYSLGQSIAAALGDALGSLLDNVAVPSSRWIGHAMVEGIVCGIYAAGPTIASALADVLNQALDAVQVTLQVSSPSRVYMDVGRQITAGMALGILQGTPDVVAALGGVAGGLDFSANGRAATVPGSGVNSGARVQQVNETHLHVGVLVADEAGLRELERRLRPVREQEDQRRGLL